MTNSMASEIREELAKGLSNREVAEWLGCSVEHVAIEKRLLRHKSKRGPASRKHQGPEIRRLLSEGVRVRDISIELGCCETTVHRHKKTMGGDGNKIFVK